MNDTNRDVTSAHESDENLYTSTPLSDLAPVSARTVRDYDKEFQDLKRENFNLKLRIYFLEEQNQSTGENQAQITYIQQLRNEIERLQRRLQSQSVQTDVSETVYNFGHEDERRALQDELDQCRQENESLRKSLQLSHSKLTRDERQKLTTTTPPPRQTFNQSIHTTTSVDSGLDTTTPGMSSTFTSSNTLQSELTEYKERERKLKEEIYSLRKQVDSSMPQTNQTLAELDQARQEIQQYKDTIEKYEQQQTKAERILQRLQAEYETRIANLVQQQRQQTTAYESYHHEQDQTTANVNIDEYRQAIDERDRIIQQLEEAINEITVRLRTPLTVMLPSHATAGWTDEHNQKIIHELNSQMQTHLATIDQLRAECVELRQGEKHLRNQIDSLTQLINAPIRNLGLPPLPRTSPPSSKTVDAIDGAQHVEDLQRAVVQITVQLQTDAENVSGLTNRVAQIIRDRDEWQDKINRLQEEIEKKNAHIRQLEKREPEVENRIRQYYILQIENFQRDIKVLQDQLRERDRLINEYKNEKEGIIIQTRKDYEKFDSIHVQERLSLQGQLRTANERLIDLEQQLKDEKRQYTELQRKYEIARSSTGSEVEQFERQIRQQKVQIEQFNLQIREIEAGFQKERRQLERERDLEKEKAIEIQNTSNASNRHYTELQTKYEQLRTSYNAQQETFDQEIRTYQKQIANFDRERGFSANELESIQLENQMVKERFRDAENRLTEITRKNEELKSRISTYEIRIHDSESIETRHRSEIERIQHDADLRIAELTRRNDQVKSQITIYETRIHDTEDIERRHRDELERLQRDFDNRLAELTRKNDQFKSQISVYETRIYDREDVEKRHRNEIERLQHDYEFRIAELTRKNDEVNLQISTYETRLYDVQSIERRHRDEIERLQRDAELRIAELARKNDEFISQISVYETRLYEFDDIERRHRNEIEKIQRDADFRVAELARKNDEIKSQITIYETRIHDTEDIGRRHRSEIERLQRDFDDRLAELSRKNDQFKSQISVYETRIYDREDVERRHQHEVERLQRDYELRIAELIRQHDEFQSRISIYETRFHDNEDLERRYRNDIERLQRDIQNISRENQDHVHEITEWRRKYDTIKTELTNAHFERERLISENQLLNEQNSRVKYDIDEFQIQIRLQIQEEYEAKYRQVIVQKEADIQNVLKEKETVRYDFDQLNSERIRLGDRLKTVEHNLIQANQTIQTYDVDLKRLRQALQVSQEENQQIQRQASHTHTVELRTKTNLLQELEAKYRSVEIQLHQYEISINELRQENAKLIESNRHLKREYEEQRTNYEALQRKLDETTKNNLKAIEEHVRKEVVQVSENKQELIKKLELQLHEKDHIIKELRDARSSYQPKDIQLDLEIQIEQLEQEIVAKETFLETHTKTLQDKDQQIENLRNSIQQINTSNTRTVETLQEDLRARDRRIEQFLNEKNSAVHECERHITELQTIIRDREREIVDTNDKLQRIQQELDIQKRELEDCRKKRDLLTVDLNIATEENETYSEKIRLLEKKQSEMSQSRNTTSDQIAHFQTIIEDLKSKLRNREDSLQSLQRTIADSEKDIKETRVTHSNIQSDYNRAQLRYEQMEKQYNIEMENRDQNIASLRKKLLDKEQEIAKLRASDTAKEAVIGKLRSKSRESEDSKSEYSGARAPTNVSLRLDLQKKDDLIEDLKRQLDRAQRHKSLSPGRENSSIAKLVEVPIRPTSSNFNHLNREELLYELEMANKSNVELVQQLAQKSPNITELHNQLLAVRKELARQKYVNQVLWRKLDALIDIQGSNTRAELAIELANYHDELEALKAKQNRADDTRAARLNANSRSSSEVNINQPLSTKSVKSTDYSENRWEKKIIHLQEQRYHYENQSRYYYRKVIKYHKLLLDAGLIDSSCIRQRRHSAEDSHRKSSTIINTIESNTKLDGLDEIKNIEKLQEIIRNQNKYIQQLQMRIRLNTPDGTQSSALEKLTEQNTNLTLVINTYKNESNVLKNELKKLYKVLECNQIKLQQYENVIREQQHCIENTSRRTNQYQTTTKRRILYPTNQNEQDDIIIDLDIDIFPVNDKQKKTSLNKKDSGVESVIESTRTLTQEHQRQLKERDAEIKQLVKQLNDLQKLHETEITQYRLKLEKSQTDSIDDLNAKQNDLRQARSQIDVLKSTKTQLEQAQDQNQRLHGEIKLLQNEIANKKELTSHYEKQLSLLEKQISSRGAGTGEMSIRTSEMSELLEEMRRLRHDLQKSINKQHELQAKLDENIRVQRTPHEFTFSGRGVSQPDLRIIDTAGLIGTEKYSFTTVTDEKRSRPIGLSATHLVTEQTNLGKAYVVGEYETHEQLRRSIADIKIELKALEVKIQEKLRSKFTTSTSEPSTEWLEHRLNTLNQCLTRLEQTYQLIELYWKANLPVKNNYDEHIFPDPSIVLENNELRLSQTKYAQELQHLRQKYKEQSVYMDQLLGQLTKANNKKASTDDYLALLLRPTLDALQKARSNMEHHLKESNNTSISSPNTAQSPRRHRTNRLD